MRVDKDVARQLDKGRVKRNGKPAQLLDFDTKGIFVSIHQFCQETGKDRASVDKKLRSGILKPHAGPNKNPVYRLRDLIDLVFYRDDMGRVDIDRLDPFRRKAHYSAELDKLRMLRESRMLIPVGEVEQEQARIAKIVTQFLDTLPDILERDCGLGAQALAVLEKRIDAAREDLYKKVKGEDDGAEEANRPDGRVEPDEASGEVGVGNADTDDTRPARSSASAARAVAAGKARKRAVNEKAKRRTT